MKNLKNLIKIKNISPLIFIVLVWFLFSSPYFINGKIPFPSQYQISFFTPWNAYEKFAGPVKNNAIPDVVTQIYPWKYFTIEELKKGSTPLWNPYSFSGTPHLANYQSAVYSPFNTLFFFLPFIDAWTLLVLIQPLIAGIGMLLFLRELKLSRMACLIGGIAFMFCGFNVVWMPYGTLSMVASFLPWCLYGIERGLGRRNFLSFFVLTLGLVFSFFSGHFQIAFYVALYSFLFIVTRSYMINKLRYLWVPLIFFTIGVIISLIQVIPTLELYENALRSKLHGGNEGGIPFQYLITLIAPDFFGNPVTRNDWFGFYAEWASFIGIIPFLLALCSFFVIKRQPLTIFFIFAALVTLLLSLDSPLQHLLSMTKLPIFSTSIPSRIIIIFSFSMIVLAAFGYDQLVDAVKKRRFKNVVIPLAIVGGIMFSAIVFIFMGFFPEDKAALAKRNLILPAALFFMTSITVIVIYFVRLKYFILVLSILLVSFTVVDSFRFATKWMPFDSKDLLYPSLPVISEMQKLIGQGRVYGDFGSYIDTYYRIPSIEGYDPLYIQRYGEFIQSAKTGKFSSAKKSEVFLDERAKYADRVLDILGVTIIYHPISFHNQPWAFPVWQDHKKYSVVYEDSRFQLYRNNTALPRAKLFYKYLVKQNDKDLIDTFYKEEFNFRDTLLLEEDPQISFKNSEQKGEVKIIMYSPNKVVIKTSTHSPALLFLSDTYYPTWKALVNGHEEKIYRTDYAFRSVKVPEGESEVEFLLR